MAAAGSDRLALDATLKLRAAVIALSGSRRTESLWVRTSVFAPGDVPVASMLLNLASIKDSYARYSQEYSELYA